MDIATYIPTRPRGAELVKITEVSKLGSSSNFAYIVKAQAWYNLTFLRHP